MILTHNNDVYNVQTYIDNNKPTASVYLLSTPVISANHAFKMFIRLFHAYTVPCSVSVFAAGRSNRPHILENDIKKSPGYSYIVENICPRVPVTTQWEI